MRYPISGTNALQVTQVAAATGLGAGDDSATSICLGSLIGNAVTTGRTFFLRGIVINQTATATSERPGILLFDGTQGGTATGSTVKTAIYPATGPNTVQKEFSAPGLRFSTGVVAALTATTLVATSAYGPGRFTIYGYEEA